MNFFYVAYSFGTYHYFAVTPNSPERGIYIGGSKSLIRLAVIKQSDWRDYELRNLDHPEFPKNITLLKARKLDSEEMQKIIEDVPSVSDLEKMFTGYNNH